MGEQEEAAPENLVGYSFIIRGRVERGKRPHSSSFLSRCHAYIINSSSRCGAGDFFVPTWSSQNCKTYFKSVYNEHLSILGIINLLSSLGRMWVSCPHETMFYCFEVCLVLLLCSFVAKQACLILWLSKHGFLSNH